MKYTWVYVRNKSRKKKKKLIKIIILHGGTTQTSPNFSDCEIT